MLCPYCNELRFSREWKPSQWSQQLATVGNFDGCRHCDLMSSGMQVRMMEKISWRYQYLSEPAARKSLNDLVRTTHHLKPLEKEKLHHGYHVNLEQAQVGEHLTHRVAKMLVREAYGEIGVANSKTGADLFESALQLCYEIQNEYWQQTRDLLELVHYLEIYRDIDPPAYIVEFWGEFLQR